MTEQRYPISVRVSGMLVHEKTKLYLTQVLWSDQNDITVYRSFEEYSVFHKRMKKIFPPANALKKSDRTIPKFKDVKMKNKVKKKGSGSGSRSVQRCKFLEKYCNELLSCDPRVCQNNELITFFHPRDQDLQQDFTKNCLMIVPSEEVKGRGARINSASNITQPFVTETYRCVAPFDTKDTKNRAFKVAVDEKLDVLIKDQAGWWLVENEDKNMAWFPAPYLEKVVDEEDGDDCEEDEMDGPYSGGNYIAVRTYKATKGDELSVEIGTQVEVLQKSDNGWWLIRNKGKAGYVPTLFLQPYSNPCDRASPNRPGSSLDNMAPPRVSAPSPGGSPFQHSISLEVAPVSPRVSPVPHSHSLDIESHHRVPATTRPQARTPSSSSSARPHTPSSSSPNHLQPTAAKQRARSLPGPGIGQMPGGPHQLNVSLGNTSPVGASTPTGRRAIHGHTTPVITVEEMDAERRWTSQAAVDSEDSFASDSSDFSINGLSSDSADDSSFNLSYDGGQADHQQQQMHHLSYEAPQTGRHSQQALSTSHNHLSPMTGATLMPATSDPSLYKRPSSPRVPPRPKDKEILTRCSTVTRKNLSRAGGGSPAALQIASR